MATNLRSVTFKNPNDAQIAEKLLAHPNIEPLTQQLAASLKAELPRLIQILANMKPGAIFRETGLVAGAQTQLTTGRRPEAPTTRTFEFFAIGTPSKPLVLTKLIAELANEPYDTPTDQMMIIYHDHVEPGMLSAYYTISMRDFCKNFALNEWVLVSEVTMQHPDDVFETKGIVDPVEGMAPMNKSPGGIILP